MRPANLPILAATGFLLACGGAQATPEAQTTRRSASDSALSADSARLTAILARDAADRQATLANESRQSVVTYAPPADTRWTSFGALDETPTPAPPAANASGVRRLTAAEAADHLRRIKGQVTVAILYGTRCPRTKAMFPSYVALAARYRGQPVQFAAFALDDYPEDIPDFLARYAAPFDLLSIRAPKVGEPRGALAQLGFFGGPAAVDPVKGVTIHMPYVAVLGRDGYARAQWHAATNIAAIDQAVQAELTR